MEIQVSQSIQQTTYDQFSKVIKEQAANKPDLVKTITEILENASLNTFSEYLRMTEVEEVNKYLNLPLTNPHNKSSTSSSKLENMRSTTTL